MGKLTTHILDVRNGKPAAGVAITLYKITGTTMNIVGQFISNKDGRTDQPLLEGDAFEGGEYQLEFDVQQYFSGQCGEMMPAFLNTIPIRFGVSDATDHYHVPLVCSPWTYSTYRGS